MPTSPLTRFLLLAGAALLLQACATESGGTPVAKGLSARGTDRYDVKTNLVSGYSTRNRDGTINVAVEIPAGTSEKWEVNASGDAIVRDYTGSMPRTIDYLPYPGNYGIIPKTLLSEAQGGDGSPLDVLVLGPAVPRGSVIHARAIGIIRVIDNMEQDDKILAVMTDSTMRDVADLESLAERYPGAGEIVALWFKNAHGSHSKVQLLGAGSRGQANAVIEFANGQYRRASLMERELK